MKTTLIKWLLTFFIVIPYTLILTGTFAYLTGNFTVDVRQPPEMRVYFGLLTLLAIGSTCALWFAVLVPEGKWFETPKLANVLAAIGAVGTLITGLYAANIIDLPGFAFLLDPAGVNNKHSSNALILLCPLLALSLYKLYRFVVISRNNRSI